MDVKFWYADNITIGDGYIINISKFHRATLLKTTYSKKVHKANIFCVNNCLGNSVTSFRRLTFYESSTAEVRRHLKET